MDGSPPFDPGYGSEPWMTLCAEVPGPEVFGPRDFRIEWGPIFHRGRLDGSARVLVIGQDPGASEAIARRILVGVAGQRVQGFLAKLGLETEYAMVNAFVYSVYGQQSADRHRDDPDIAVYRDRWLDALLLESRVEAVIAFGRAAEAAFRGWRERRAEHGGELLFERMVHPTQPDAAAGDDEERRAELTRDLLSDWNTVLERLHPRLAPAGHGLEPYGEAFESGELPIIPAADLPPGLPAWMRSPEPWARRVGEAGDERRRTLTVIIPPSFPVG